MISVNGIVFGILFLIVNEVLLIDVLFGLVNGIGMGDDYGKLFFFVDVSGDLLFSFNGDVVFMFGDDFIVIVFLDG